MSNELKDRLALSEKMLRMYEGLFEANAAVTSSLNMREVLNLVMKKAQELLDTEAASIFLIDHKTNELVLEVSTNLPDQLVHNIRFPRGKGVAGWVAAHGRPVVTDDISKDPRFYSGVQKKTGFVTQSYMCVPLKLQETVIGTAQVLNRRDGSSFSREDLLIMEGFARQAAIALENSRLHAEEIEKKRLEEELKQAHRIQSNMLPLHDPEIAGYDISGVSYPCRWVGGDYYDFIDLPRGEMGIAVADVCGKGVPAAVMMSSIQAVLHSLAEQDLPMRDIVPNLNRYLCLNTSNDKFVTFFYGELDSANHQFIYTNCGHNPPYILRKNGEIEALSKGGLILGVMEDTDFELGKVSLEAGEIMLLFTDGVTEIHNDLDEMFEDDRLIEMVKEISELPACEIIDAVHREGIRFAGSRGLDDDFTLLCIKRTI